MNKYVLYDSTDDSVICGNDWKAVLFDSYEDAEEEWTGYPEAVTHFNNLPLHHQQLILKENENRI